MYNEVSDCLWNEMQDIRQRADPLLGYYGTPTPFTEGTTDPLDNIDILALHHCFI